MKEHWILGRPATYATQREKLWKQKLAEGLNNTKNGCPALEFEFYFNGNDFDNYALDVDNLCEPVFQVLISTIGWFDGRRTNIKSWKATKAIGNNEELLIKDTDKIEISDSDCDTIFDQIYTGTFPQHARSDEIPSWITSVYYDAKKYDHYNIHLQFGIEKLSIATISSGKVKPIIDSLYPILGGTKGDPDDHKITELWVEKAIEGLSENQFRIIIQISTD